MRWIQAFVLLAQANRLCNGFVAPNALQLRSLTTKSSDLQQQCAAPSRAAAALDARAVSTTGSRAVCNPVTRLATSKCLRSERKQVSTYDTYFENVAVCTDSQ
jgi:hypothetical protein